MLRCVYVYGGREQETYTGMITVLHSRGPTCHPPPLGVDRGSGCQSTNDRLTGQRAPPSPQAEVSLFTSVVDGTAFTKRRRRGPRDPRRRLTEIKIFAAHLHETAARSFIFFAGQLEGAHAGRTSRPVRSNTPGALQQHRTQQRAETPTGPRAEKYLAQQQHRAHQRTESKAAPRAAT